MCPRGGWQTKGAKISKLDSNAFWFFTTFYASFGSGQCLCLFFAGSLTGEWNSRPCNPISMDIRNARNGGRLFRKEGKLFRVGQNGAGQYGVSFSFNKIITLTKADHRDILTKTIQPWPPPTGTHTHNRFRELESSTG